MKAATLAVVMVLVPLACIAAMIATRHHPAPFVITEDSPGWCATHSYFPCGVWPIDLPNHEG